MRRVFATTATGLALLLAGTACGSEAPPPADACTKSGIELDPSLPESGYTMIAELLGRGANSVQVRVVDVETAGSLFACRRLGGLSLTRPLKAHDNFNTDDDRIFTCSVVQQDKKDTFKNMKPEIDELLKKYESAETSPVVRMQGERVETYTSTDKYGNENYELRDICRELVLPWKDAEIPAPSTSLVTVSQPKS